MSIAMFPQFAATTDTLNKVSSLVSGVGTDAHIYDDPQDANIPTLLASKFEAEKAQGMKRLIALMSQGHDVSNYFPHVVKNVASQSLEVKKLVYIYLVHYAEQRPDEALLSINTFQRDLSDINPLVRAWALRSMSGIRVRVVLPLVVVAVSKCARDPSSYVRRSAANAISKLVTLDQEQHHDTLEELVFLLLNDNSAGVIGAAAAAFVAVCPERLSLLGPRFRKLCQLLPDVEEWGQVMVMDILVRFVIAKYGLPNNSAALVTNSWSQWTQRNVNLTSKSSFEKAHISQLGGGGNGTDEDREIISPEKVWHPPYSDLNFWEKTITGSCKSATNEQNHDDNRDIQCLLQCTLSLLSSRNSGVVMTAAGIHWMLAPKQDVGVIVKPLLFILRSSTDSQYVVLSNILMFVKAMPKLFENQYEDFFIRTSDTGHVRALKLDILMSIATESSIHAILQEFEAYVRDPNREFAAQCVNAIGRCALRISSIRLDCMRGLLMLATDQQNNLHLLNETNKEEDLSVHQRRLQKNFKVNIKKGQIKDESKNEARVVTEAVLALRAIIHKDPMMHEKEFALLIQKLDLIRVSAARAVVIWMLGEHSSVGTRISSMISVVLRYLAASFTRESDETRLQILNTTAKVMLRSYAMTDEQFCEKVISVVEYVLNLGIHDSNYDIRDRACMLRRLLICLLKHISNASKMEYEMKSAASSSALADLSGRMSVDKEKQALSGLTGINAEDYLHTQDMFPEHLCTFSTSSNCSCLFIDAAKDLLLFPKPVPVLPELSAVSSRFLPGSMSQIVQHMAPGYRLLPEFQSISKLGTSPNRSVVESSQSRDGTFENEKLVEDGHSSANNIDEESSLRSYSAESSEEENGYGGEEHSDGSSYQNLSEVLSGDEIRAGDHGKSNNLRDEPELDPASTHQSEKGRDLSRHENSTEYSGALISLSDSETRGALVQGESHENITNSSYCFSGLMSSVDLESWLQSSSSNQPALESSLGEREEVQSGYRMLSVETENVEPKKYKLLDFTNGAGLEVDYCFSRIASIYSENMACVRLFFHNKSSETLVGVTVMALDSHDSPWTHQVQMPKLLVCQA